MKMQAADMVNICLQTERCSGGLGYEVYIVLTSAGRSGGCTVLDFR